MQFEDKRPASAGQAPCYVSERAVTSTVKLTSRYWCTITAGPAAFLVEWHPDIPPPRSLGKGALQRYRTARDKLLRQLGEMIGGSVGVIEVWP
jgi:hypothetical protein